MATDLRDDLTALITAAARKGLAGEILTKDLFWDSDSQEWAFPPDNYDYLAAARIGSTLVIADKPDGRALGLTLIGPESGLLRQLWDGLRDDDDDSDQ